MCSIMWNTGLCPLWVIPHHLTAHDQLDICQYMLYLGIFCTKFPTKVSFLSFIQCSVDPAFSVQTNCDVQWFNNRLIPVSQEFDHIQCNMNIYICCLTLLKQAESHQMFQQNIFRYSCQLLKSGRLISDDHQIRAQSEGTDCQTMLIFVS